MPELRAIFDEDAALYDRARPGYPAELLATLADLTDIAPGSRVLEIGPGTGQATLALAGLGAAVTAVELGEGLAGILRRKAAGRSVEVVHSSFEDFALPAEPYAVVASFTAWHWLTPGLRADKVATALRGGGHLATVATIHVAAGEADTFPDAVQQCYERWDPDTPPGLRIPTVEDVAPVLDEVDESPDFDPGERRRFVADVTYDAASYLDVLRTYSGHRALEPERREGLLACIADLIERAYAGRVTKRYLYELRVARKAAPRGDSR